MKLVFATGNEGKLKEVSKLFYVYNVEVISPKQLGKMPDIIEDGDTFEANAKIKAEEIFKMYGVPTIADDSGLEVEQLNNEPGVYSARYAGEGCSYDDNNKKILAELEKYSAPHSARFVCCAVYYDGKNYAVNNGYLVGEIINEFKGKNGFGYDPIFKPAGYDKTLAELALTEKNSISHRGKAFTALRKSLIEKGLIK
jgi:XTP/dITP diphosphohydrolase